MSGKIALARSHKRWISRLAFFALFVLAPPLDLFRLDLTLGHFVLLGHSWTLGLDPFLRGEVTSLQAAVSLLARGLLPILGILGLLGYCAWRYGRVYCGWLCPHFSVVELINGVMRRATGRPTLWEKGPVAYLQADGRPYRRHRAYRWVLGVAVLGFAGLWALTLLTYLLPPAEIYHNLRHFSLTRNQGLFLIVATCLFAAEFLLARHLFCRYGCAVGLFQSFLWMANPRARMVAMDRARVYQCADCAAVCDDVCPMRLKPRIMKRRMFTCTQCTRCLDACATVQDRRERGPVLYWVQGEAARSSEQPLRELSVADCRVWKKRSGACGIG